MGGSTAKEACAPAVCWEWVWLLASAFCFDADGGGKSCLVEFPPLVLESGGK